MSRTSSVTDPLIQQTLLGEAVDGAPVAIFVIGDDRKVVAVNATACRLLGYEREELLALDPADFAPEADLDARFQELLLTGELSGRTQLRTKSGELIDVGYRTAATTAARMRFWISVVIPD